MTCMKRSQCDSYTTHLTKEGVPDKRYHHHAVGKESAIETEPIHLTKEGVPDKRFGHHEHAHHV